VLLLIMVMIVVMKGSAMNSKLLKVCAAVMLIAGAGNVVGDPTPGTTDKSSKKRRAVKYSETTAEVKAEVKVLVDVEFDGQKQERNLISSDGNAIPGEFKFKVNRISAGYGLKFEPTGNLEVDEKGRVSLKDADGDKLDVGLTLMDGEQNVVQINFGSPIRFNPNTHKTGEWVLSFIPELKDDVYETVYSGGVKISVVATN